MHRARGHPTHRLRRSPSPSWGRDGADCEFRALRTSEGVPGGLLGELQIADIDAGAEADAGADGDEDDVALLHHGHAETADGIGGAIYAGVAAEGVVGGAEIVDQHHDL